MENDRKPDDSPKKAALDPIKREFDDIIIPSNEKYPPDITAKIAPQSAESLPPENFVDDQFLIAHVTYRPSVHLGLTINSNNGIVVISGVDKDSLAFRRFEFGDLIIDVESERIKDKNEF
uniref:PDZ domain-containing protein n=1 Tax=Panagrolaimus davidi TaxID=227884 RepID=A0A914QJ63_9BILA